MANPFLKSTFQDVWDSCADELDETCKRKFRSIHDVNQYLFQYWQLATGSFYPKRYNYGCLSPIDDIHLIKRTLSQKRKEQLCINDNAWADISGLKKELQNIFVNVFPEKSSFELY